MVEVVIWVIIIIFALWVFRVFHLQNVKIKRMQRNVEGALKNLHDVTTKFKTAIEALERVGKDQMDK
mgnify:CR=1 FL=1